MPFKTITNVSVDPGIVNDLPDLCKVEDFEPISVVVRRFMRTVDPEQVRATEYAYDAANLPDISEDTAFDVNDMSDDVLDNAVEMEDYFDSRRSVSAGSGAAQRATTSDERAQLSEEQGSALTSSEEPKPNDVD